MTNQQMQYAYWQRMRQQQVYRAYAAGVGSGSIHEYAGLCFTAEEISSTVKLQNVAGSYQISTNGKNWTDYRIGDEVTLADVGNKVYFAAKDSNDTCWDGSSQRQKFVMTGKIAASGNIQSLLNKTCQRTDVKLNCYSFLFNGCSALTEPPTLAATTLGAGCYCYMFQDCTYLRHAPDLKAESLNQHCYYYMFKGCNALTQTPEIQATRLANNCCTYMFQNCIKLNKITPLPATALADACYRQMFEGCTSLKISENGSDGTIVLDLPAGTKTYVGWSNNMFNNTGGSFKGTPSVGKTYRCYQ